MHCITVITPSETAVLADVFDLPAFHQLHDAAATADESSLPSLSTNDIGSQLLTMLSAIQRQLDTLSPAAAAPQPPPAPEQPPATSAPLHAAAAQLPEASSTLPTHNDAAADQEDMAEDRSWQDDSAPWDSKQADDDMDNFTYQPQTIEDFLACVHQQHSSNGVRQHHEQHQQQEAAGRSSAAAKPPRAPPVRPTRGRTPDSSTSESASTFAARQQQQKGAHNCHAHAKLPFPVKVCIVMLYACLPLLSFWCLLHNHVTAKDLALSSAVQCAWLLCCVSDEANIILMTASSAT